MDKIQTMNTENDEMPAEVIKQWEQQAAIEFPPPYLTNYNSRQGYVKGRKNQYLEDRKERRELAEKAITLCIYQHQLCQADPSQKLNENFKNDLLDTLFPTSKIDIPNQ